MQKKPNYKKTILRLEEQLDIKSKLLEFSAAIDPSQLTDLHGFEIVGNPRLKEECTAISQLSDIHLDEIVKKSIVNGLSEYNQDIAADCVEKYFRRLLYVVNQCRKGGIVIKTLILHLGGDGISGWIHDELKQTSIISPIEGSLILERLYINGLKFLSEYGKFDKIVVICTVGNHSRTTEKNQFKNTATTSYEWMVYKHLFNTMPLLGCNNIEFLISDSKFSYYRVYNKLNMFCHGNHFNYQGGIGGIYVPLNKFILRENRVMQTQGGIDMIWMGHWHQCISIPGARVNGSVIGYNEMSRAYGFAPEPRLQQFQLLDKKRGFTLNNPINLTDF